MERGCPRTAAMGKSSRRRRQSDESESGKKRKWAISEVQIAAYVAEKAQKKAMRSAKKTQTVTVAGYSNASNPFGDSNLNEKFVWKKKIERAVVRGATLDEFSVKAEKKRQRESLAEIEKVKRRREERAVEKARHEEETALLARERARAEFRDWEKNEVQFGLDQSKVRSEIRLRQGRAKPIDILIKHLDGLDMDYNMVFKGLTVKELQELRDDIKMHLDLVAEEETTHVEYWKALLLVVCDRARGAELLAEERGVHSSIEADVRDYLHRKTYKELDNLHSGVESQLRSGAAKVVEFWEAVLKRIHIYKAEAFLKEFHTKRLDGGIQEEEADVDPEEDKDERTEPQRRRQQATMASEDSFELKALEEGDQEVYQPWHDKYRPRKPNYFNRVHTGYAWNRYNRTHYDHENPPPKMVQGYKFNIFYPDLVDGSKAPTQTIHKDGDSAETCIIRFHAGPPYEDIAFRIVNREWEHSHKKGFKYTFERGTLQLHFNFKRYRYRR